MSYSFFVDVNTMLRMARLHLYAFTVRGAKVGTIRKASRVEQNGVQELDTSLACEAIIGAVVHYFSCYGLLTAIR